jgi:hypothetical protein
MNSRNNCKACSASVKVKNVQIKEMLDEIEANESFELAHIELYNFRLSKCDECKYLQYETTCMQCGCIVQIRARLANSTCPFPSVSRW